ncbi:hypothetical protein [Roseovarius sp. 2305UL8-3]|uniref:hypothetical protein n=1 Tax=Roseovarius conchicola TaxID=3121636 RepID=UPI00352788D8
MKREPKRRFWSLDSIEFLSKELKLPEYSQLFQDWPFQVADTEDLDRYLELFYTLASDSEARFTLTDIIIQAFDDILGSDNATEFCTDKRWTSFLDVLDNGFQYHEWQVWYWSGFDDEERDDEDNFHVAEYMRKIWYRRLRPN